MSYFYREYSDDEADARQEAMLERRSARRCPDCWAPQDGPGVGTCPGPHAEPAEDDDPDEEAA
jgi:hypothetical protein